MASTQLHSTAMRRDADHARPCATLAVMDTDVTAHHVDIDAADGTADAVFVHPAAGGPHPGVLLYMDAYGIRPALEAHAARLAASGYCVLVPNVFYRTGRSPVLENLEQLMQSEDRSALFAQLGPKIQAVTPEAANADAGAWLGFLRDRAEARDGPIGTVGYCMGGPASTAPAWPPTSPTARTWQPSTRPASSTSDTPTTTGGWIRSRWAA
jgi:carboxymethylenebutenolidase